MWDTKGLDANTRPLLNPLLEKCAILVLSFRGHFPHDSDFKTWIVRTRRPSRGTRPAPRSLDNHAGSNAQAAEKGARL